jgi:hypothetical protein
VATFIGLKALDPALGDSRRVVEPLRFVAMVNADHIVSMVPGDGVATVESLSNGSKLYVDNSMYEIVEMVEL